MGFASGCSFSSAQTRMAERYKIYEKLGAGGVGAVFRAYDSQLKRWVAVKRLMTANEAAEDRNIAAELRREADALASLRNPNIVTIFDVAADEEGLFMVMELLQGEDLADVVARGPLPYDDFKELASQCLEGLLSAHQHHILHRDIKPENIKVERLPGGRLQAKIIDFGLARAGLRARKQTEDQEGTVMGSIYYMAPEQLTREPVDERTDLYSLGCVFYEALSGKKAFDAQSMAEVIDKHIEHTITPLHVVAPHVPQWLGAWCARLMAQKPEDRPLNAQQAIEEFRAWEKMPTMVPYGPWMGMYASQPVYMPPVQPMYPPGTGTVPLGGYYQPAQQPGTGAVPVEIIPEAQRFVETAAVTTHLAPSPRKPGTGRTTASARPSSVLSSAPPAKQDKVKKIALIGGGAVILVVGTWLIFGKSGGAKGGGSTGAGMLAAVGISQDPPKVRFQLPQDRSYPPADRGIALFYVSNTGILTNRKGGDGKPAGANTNESVVEWHDLAERGGDNILRSFGGNTDNAPKRSDWPTTPNTSGPKGGRPVLDFRPRNGKPCAMELDSTGKELANMPFGSNPVPGGEKGLTLVAVFQPDALRLPTRLVTLSNKDGSSVSLRVDDKKNIVAEIRNGKDSPNLVSNAVNGSLPCTAFLTWHAGTGAVELRVRDADGRTFTSKDGKASAPSKALDKLQIGRTNGGAPDQFSGFFAELIAYATVLKNDQLQLMDGRLKDHYFQSAPPTPFKERIKTKLPWIEPRKSWKLSTSHKKEDCGKAVDGNTGSRWTTNESMKGGEWFTVELPSETDIAGVALDSQGSSQDFPRKCKVEISTNGSQWNAAAEVNGSTVTEVIFKTPLKGRFVRMTQTGSAGNYWGINELVLLKP